ncbi:polyamine aminopropyltransferase [Uliginosibacterium sp. H1]|uniref:spermine/spermidine synthase domain-containing protein n=1 Tax=Uliginosibacterium sp. H1 TaxID=3114757 RepID=UPI002E194B24|nr:polyamine aminopropyltransferase [Uliginosibacterium sp. H1]
MHEPFIWLELPPGDAVRQRLRVSTCVAQGRSAHQAWEVWDSPDHGRLYRLDGHAMAATADEHRCHEPLVHMPGLAHPAPCDALVLGGGDGASAREMLKYPGLQTVVVAELDAAVVEMSRRWLPSLPAGAFDDPRLQLRIGDARDYVVDAPAASVDLVVFDLTDPEDSPASGLYGADFLAACKRLLRAGGLLSLHLGHPVAHAQRIDTLLARLQASFRIVCLIHTDVPLYGGPWLMACASDDTDPLACTPTQIRSRIAALRAPLRCIDDGRYRQTMTRA